MQNTKHSKQLSLCIFLTKCFDKSFFGLACSSWDLSNGGSDDSKCCLKVVFTSLSIVAIQKCAPNHTLSCGIVYRKMMSKLVQFLVLRPGFNWFIEPTVADSECGVELGSRAFIFIAPCRKPSFRTDFMAFNDL